MDLLFSPVDDVGKWRRGRDGMAPASVSASAESESFVRGGEEEFREVLAVRFRRVPFVSCPDSVSSSFLFSPLRERAWVGVLSMSISESLLISCSLCAPDEELLAGTGALPFPAICPPGTSANAPSSAPSDLFTI